MKSSAQQGLGLASPDKAVAVCAKEGQKFKFTIKICLCPAADQSICR